MNELTVIKNAKKKSKILVVVSFIILIFGLLFNHLPIVTIAWAISVYAHGLQWSVIWFYERQNK
jgi:hypothetical protein